MACLSLQFKDVVQGEYPLIKGKSITIGRKQTNDIVIDNLAVSSNHAKVDVLDEGVLLTDLRSKNGTFVNKQLVTSHWLEKGDVITIGKHDLIYIMEEGEEPAAVSDENLSDKTMVLDTDEYRQMVQQSSTTLNTTAEQSLPVGVLSFLKGGEGEVELTKKLVKIGKDSVNDIIIGGFMMAKTAATISRRPTGYYLNFVEGMHKPKLNGTVVKDSAKLKEFDVIEIGSAKMEFIMKDE